ncbi:MAG: tetratricopeptide repeat protein [Syntrophobacteraceae bacterium]
MASSADNIQFYGQMLKLDPGSRVFALLAEELCAAGLWEEAAEVCRKGLRYHPDHLRSRVLLGQALMEMGEADESEQVLQKIVDEICNNTVIFKLLSEFATFSGAPDRAGAFSKIYDAFQATDISSLEGGAPVAPVLVPEPPPEAVSEVPDIDDLMAQALNGAAVPEELEPAREQIPESEPASLSPEVIAEMDTEMESAADRPSRLEEILSGLAGAIEQRFSTDATLPPLLSGADKDFLKKTILGQLAACSRN